MSPRAFEAQGDLFGESPGASAGPVSDGDEVGGESLQPVRDVNHAGDAVGLTGRKEFEGNGPSAAEDVLYFQINKPKQANLQRQR